MKKVFTLLVIFVFLLIAGKTFSQSDYSGTVRYIDAARTPVKSVTVKLHDAFGNLVATEITNGAGKYNFKNLSPGSYTLNFSGYISAHKYDGRNAYLILMNLFGVIQLTPVQTMAADINENGRVDWDDLRLLTRDYFLYGRSNSIGKIVALPKQISVGGNLLKGGDDDEIGGTGDPDGAFLPTIKARETNFQVKYLKSLKIISNQFVEVPVYLNNQTGISGFALTLNYAAKALNFEQLSSQVDGIEFNESNGIIKVTWQNISGVSKIDFSEPMFTLRFSASSISAMKELKNITINSESQLVDMNGAVIKDAQFGLPALIGSEGINELTDIYPNPIYNTANINYSLSANYNVSLNIYNTVGQLVTTLVNKEQTAGNYQVVFNRSNLHLSAGSYIYRLECKGENPFVKSKIMIIR